MLDFYPLAYNTFLCDPQVRHLFNVGLGLLIKVRHLFNVGLGLLIKIRHLLHVWLRIAMGSRSGLGLTGKRDYERD